MADAQLTPLRMAPATSGPVGLGLGTADHSEPSQCSVRVPVGFPVPDATTAPTAQQSDPLTHVAPKNPPPSPGGNEGVTSDHAEPFHDSMSGFAVDGPPPPRLVKEMPTAQHWSALAHVVASGTSSAPVPGTAATYHPDVAAVAVGVAKTPAPPSAATDATPRVKSAARRRRTRRMPDAGCRLRFIEQWSHRAPLPPWMVTRPAWRHART